MQPTLGCTLHLRCIYAILNICIAICRHTNIQFNVSIYFAYTPMYSCICIYANIYVCICLYLCVYACIYVLL